MKKCFYIFQLTFVGLVLLLLSSCTATHYSANRYFKKNHRATERWVHKNDTIALVQGIDFDVPEVGRIILSDMSVERVRSIQCPILKLIGTDGQQLVVSKGLCYVCSAFPDGLFYLLDESNRVIVAEGNRLNLLSGRLKISEVPSWLLFPDVNQEIMNH